MNQQAQQTSNPVQKKSPVLTILLVILSIIVIGLAVWLYLSQSDLKQLTDEKEQQRQHFVAELDSLLAEHNKVKAEYGELADTLYVRDSIIIANAKEIKNLLNYKWEYYKINKKVKKLQKIAQGYVRQMDSLYILTDSLRTENVKITRKYETQVAKTRSLEEVKEQLTEKVNMAEVLQTYNLNADGIQMRWGGDKEKVTDKAKKVNKFKICFTLGENLIVPHGNKQLYIRIAQPDKLILTPSRGDDYSFMYQGEKLQYSIMKEVNYDGNPMDLCLYWTKRGDKEEMMTGIYHVEIFEGDNVIGHTTISLR